MDFIHCNATNIMGKRPAAQYFPKLPVFNQGFWMGVDEVELAILHIVHVHAGNGLLIALVIIVILVIVITIVSINNDTELCFFSIWSQRYRKACPSTN